VAVEHARLVWWLREDRLAMEDVGTPQVVGEETQTLIPHFGEQRVVEDNVDGT